MKVTTNFGTVKVVMLKGEKGDKFQFEDYTPEELESLRGEQGEPFTYDDFTEEQLEDLRSEVASAYYRKIDATYYTIGDNTETIAIPIEGYNDSDMLFVDVEGLALAEGVDYTIEGSNIVLTTPITHNYTAVNFRALRAFAITTEDYDSLIGDLTSDLDSYVDEWLLEHPEATTTVQDNSVTDAKLVQSGGVLSKLKTLTEVSITTTGGYINGDGSIANPSSNQEVYTNKIPVLPGEIYDVKLTYPNNNFMWLAYGLYDIENKFISRTVINNGGSRISTGGGIVTIPNGVYAVSFTYRTYGNCEFTVSLQKLETLNNEAVSLKTETKLLNDSNNSLGNSIAITESLLSDSAILINLSSEYGGFDNDGKESSSSTRIRSAFFSNRNNNVYITPAPGYMFGIWTYSDGGNVWSGWKTKKTKLPISEKIRLLFDSSPSGTLTPNLESWNSKFTISTDVTQQIPNNYVENIGSISRQGYQPDYPPHSIAAYKEAYKCGFRIMLCDVRFTVDDVPVCLHDGSINSEARNTDGTTLGSYVYISDITLDQANGYDWGIKYGSQFAGLEMPTLESVAAFAKWTNCELYVEIKGLPTVNQYDAIYSVLDKYNFGKNLSFSASYLSILQEVTSHYPTARLGFGVNATGVSQTNIDSMLGLKTDNNEVFFHVWNNDMVSGVITDTMLELLAGTGIGFELTEITSESGFNDFIGDANNTYVTRCAIRYKPIEKYLYDYFVK